MAGLTLFARTLSESTQNILMAGSAVGGSLSTPPPEGAQFTTLDERDIAASFDGEGLLSGDGIDSLASLPVTPGGTKLIAEAFNPALTLTRPGAWDAPQLAYAAAVIDEAPMAQGATEPVQVALATLPPEALETGNGVEQGPSTGANSVDGIPIPAKAPILSKGGVSLAGGYSSLQGVTLEASIVRSGLADGAQELSATFRRSDLQRAAEVGFADADMFDTGIVFGATLFTATRQALGFSERRSESPFAEGSHGLKLSLAKKFGESLSLVGQYRLSRDSIHLNHNQGSACDAVLRGSVACGALGKWMTSAVNLSLVLDRRDDANNPTRGYRLRLGQDFAGLGGGPRYTRPSLQASAHVPINEGITLSLGAEGGLIRSLGHSSTARSIPVFERFFLGGSDLRGFDLRGVGPRVTRVTPTGQPLSGTGANTPVGGRAYYSGRAEMSFALGGKLGRMGLKPVLFADVGSVFGAKATGLVSSAFAQTVPLLDGQGRALFRATDGSQTTQATAAGGQANQALTQTLPSFSEVLTGNAMRPRVAVGAGLGWVTPLGEIRFDLAKAVKKQQGDVTQPFSISFGARF
jgi:outer membrane protein assembly factor BamA